MESWAYVKDYMLCACGFINNRLFFEECTSTCRFVYPYFFNADYGIGFPAAANTGRTESAG